MEDGSQYEVLTDKLNSVNDMGIYWHTKAIKLTTDSKGQPVQAESIKYGLEVKDVETSTDMDHLPILEGSGSGSTNFPEGIDVKREVFALHSMFAIHLNAAPKKCLLESLLLNRSAWKKSRAPTFKWTKTRKTREPQSGN